MDDLDLGQLPVVMPHYPHMLFEDTGTWTTFLEQQNYGIKRVWYDIRVGVPVSIPGATDETLRKIADGVSRKRIDAVCSVGGGLWVVEIKPYASMQAVGQVITYARLFRNQYNSPGRIVPVIVCDDYDEDLLDEFDELGILVLKND